MELPAWWQRCRRRFRGTRSWSHIRSKMRGPYFHRDPDLSRRYRCYIVPWGRWSFAGNAPVPSPNLNVMVWAGLVGNRNVDMAVIVEIRNGHAVYTDADRVGLRARKAPGTVAQKDRNVASIIGTKARQCCRPR